MSPRQKILAIRLTEKLAKNPEYARTIGVEISNKKDGKDNSDGNIIISRSDLLLFILYLNFSFKGYLSRSSHVDSIFLSVPLNL